MNRQSGVALLTALIVVTLGTLIAASMSYRLQLQIRREANLMAREQAYHIALGLEDWAMVALRRDGAESGSVDSRVEPWAQGLPVLPTDRGVVTGRMEDLDGRFNLNNLVVEGRRQSRQIAQFRRLLAALELDPLLAERLADWLDPDSLAGQDGVEDNGYSREQPSYRAANAPLVHLSELRLVAGVDEAVLERLSPHVSALPVAGGPSPINVNTATVPVLMSLHELMTQRMAETLWQNGQAAHQSVNDFLKSPPLRPLAPFFPELRSGLTVDSRYFLARGQVVVDEIPQTFFSLIEQGRGGFRVIRRTRGSA